jgi:uncharacterized protein
MGVEPGHSEERLEFLPGVAEKLRFYVYALVDPRDSRIFYVGKGKGDRVYQHARNAQAVGEDRRSAKINQIREIHAKGLQVGVEIIRHNLEDDQAYEVEAGVIDALRLTGLPLTNKASGKGSRSQGHRSLDALRAEYGARPAAFDRSHRIVLIRINRRFHYGMSGDELYEATRKWWKMAPSRRPDYAFAVYDGVIRAVYRIDPDGWERDPATGRRAFTATRDAEMEERYAWSDVSDRLPRGGQNPIRYVGC